MHQVLILQLAVTLKLITQYMFNAVILHCIVINTSSSPACCHVNMLLFTCASHFLLSPFAQLVFLLVGFRHLWMTLAYSVELLECHQVSMAALYKPSGTQSLLCKQAQATGSVIAQFPKAAFQCCGCSRQPAAASRRSACTIWQSCRL